MKEGCGIRERRVNSWGRSRCSAADSGPVRARALSDERKRETAPLLCARYYSLSVQAAPNSTRDDRVTEK